MPFVLTGYPSYEQAPARRADAVEAHRPHDRVLAGVDRPGSTYDGEWADVVLRSRDHAEGAHLRAHRRDRGRAHDVAARADRRRAQLGLPLLLAARRHVHDLLADQPRATPTRRRSFRDWLLRAVAGDPAHLQIMYGPAGERRLDEYEVDWLPGYEGSKPVRVGNAAHGQYQLDVYGEVLDAMHQSRRMGIEEDPNAWAVQQRDPRLPRVRLARARRRHLGGARRAQGLRPLEGDGVGRVRPGGEGRRGVRARRTGRPLARVSRRRSTTRCARRGSTPSATPSCSRYGSKDARRQRADDPARGIPPRRRPARGRHRRRDRARAADRRLRAPLPVRRRRRRPPARRRASSSPARSGWPTTSACWAAPTRPAHCSSASSGWRNDVGLLSEEYDPVVGAHARATSRRRSPTCRW